jgi:hypothetical protein
MWGFSVPGLSARQRLFADEVSTALGDSYNSAKLFKVTVKGEGMGHA